MGPTTARHLDVEDGHVGALASGQLDGLDGVLGHPDNREAVFALEQLSERLPNVGIVVRDQDPGEDRGGHGTDPRPDRAPARSGIQAVTTVPRRAPASTCSQPPATSVRSRMLGRPR